MVRLGYTNIFWGFLFIMFNVRIQGIDILPDFVGFILLLFGFIKLNQSTRIVAFRYAFGFSVPLLALSFLTLYQPPGNGIGGPSQVSVFITMLVVLLSISMMVAFCTGTRLLAERSLNSELARIAQKRALQYAVLNLAGFLIVFGVSGPLIMLVLVVFDLMMLVSILTFIHRSRAELA